MTLEDTVAAGVATIDVLLTSRLDALFLDLIAAGVDEAIVDVLVDSQRAADTSWRAVTIMALDTFMDRG